MKKRVRSEIKAQLEALATTLVEMKRLGEMKKSLVNALADEFDRQELRYRNGIATPSGILVRKPSWCFEVKSVAGVA